mmetsp:Transcript_12849/g.23262  ORF Transcript_12849/g.23262 Transcript_12849/m.23262 type:complete len:207 (+) Transcript_12849:116-736(+)
MIYGGIKNGRNKRNRNNWKRNRKNNTVKRNCETNNHNCKKKKNLLLSRNTWCTFVNAVTTSSIRRISLSTIPIVKNTRTMPSYTKRLESLSRTSNSEPRPKRTILSTTWTTRKMCTKKRERIRTIWIRIQTKKKKTTKVQATKNLIQRSIHHPLEIGICLPPLPMIVVVPVARAVIANMTRKTSRRTTMTTMNPKRWTQLHPPNWP